jgi:hypothetical protein
VNSAFHFYTEVSPARERSQEGSDAGAG